jgi:hypothetical protein
VDLHRVGPGLLVGGDDHLQLQGPLGGNRQRCLEDQLLEVGGADLLAGPQAELGEGGPGQDRGAGDGVVGQPGQLLLGETAGQQVGAFGCKGDRGGEQGMLGGALAGGAEVAGSRRQLQPVPLALEGVGGQLGGGGAAALEQGREVDGDAVGVGLGEGAEQAPCASLLTAQGVEDRGALPALRLGGF